MAVGSIARRVRGTGTVLRQIPGQRRAHALPRERLLDRRDARVRELVRYAASRASGAPGSTSTRTSST